jgi:hypothetical protein
MKRLVKRAAFLTLMLLLALGGIHLWKQWVGDSTLKRYSALHSSQILDKLRDPSTPVIELKYLLLIAYNRSDLEGSFSDRLAVWRTTDDANLRIFVVALENAFIPEYSTARYDFTSALSSFSLPNQAVRIEEIALANSIQKEVEFKILKVKRLLVELGYQTTGYGDLQKAPFFYELFGGFHGQ